MRASIVKTAEIGKAHKQQAVDNKSHFNGRNKQNQQRLSSEKNSSHPKEQSTIPLHNYRQTSIGHSKQQSIISEQMIPYPSSWLPPAQLPKSKNVQREKIFHRQNPGDGAVPNYKQKRNKNHGTKDGFPASQVSHQIQIERRSYDNQTQFKVNKLRNTYKPLVNEDRNKRPVSIQYYPQIIGQTPLNNSEICDKPLTSQADQQNSRNVREDAIRLITNQTPLNQFVVKPLTSKQSPISQSITNQSPTVNFSRMSPRQIKGPQKQERYMEKGHRSDLRKLVYSPHQINQRNLRFKQHSVEIINSSIATGDASPTHFSNVKRSTAKEEPLRKSENQAVKKAVKTSQQFQKNKKDIAEQKSNFNTEKMEQMEKIKTRKQKQYRAYVQPVRNVDRKKERLQSTLGIANNANKSFQFKGGNPQQPESIDQVVVNSEQEVGNFEGLTSQSQARQQNHEHLQPIIAVGNNHVSKEQCNLEIRQIDSLNTFVVGDGTNEYYANSNQVRQTDPILAIPQLAIVDHLQNASREQKRYNEEQNGADDYEPVQPDMPLPSVRIQAPTSPQISIPNEPYKPKYLFNSTKDKNLTTINENKETIEKFSIEEKMQTSSIMAMQLEGLGNRVENEKLERHKFFTFEQGHYAE